MSRGAQPWTGHEVREEELCGQKLLLLTYSHCLSGADVRLAVDSRILQATQFMHTAGHLDETVQSPFL